MADRPPNSSNWEVMGEAYYRKEEVYEMSWRPGDLSDYKVSGARCGGPIGRQTRSSRHASCLSVLWWCSYHA